MVQKTVKGTVYWDGGLPVEKLGRASGAVLKYRSGQQSGSSITDDDGDFCIPEIEGSEVLTLTILHEDADSMQLAVDAQALEEPIAVRLVARESAGGRTWGAAAMLAAFLMVVALVSGYWHYHQQAGIEASNAQSALRMTLTRLSDVNAVTEIERATALLQEANERLEKTEGTRIPLDDSQRAAVERLLAFKSKLVDSELPDLARAAQSSLATLQQAQQAYFWTAWPWLFVELWSWGLLGVLITKLVRIGWYLRKGMYYPRGTWMHFSHIVTTPFLAFVAVLLLSFVKLEGEAGTVVDLSNPMFMVITAFLLSTNPWGLWDFVLSRGEALRTKGTADD